MKSSPHRACLAHCSGCVKKALRKLIPYWLRSHHEGRCVACGAPHAHAVEVHCVACDQPHCPMCTVQIDGELFCATCADDGGTR